MAVLVSEGQLESIDRALWSASTYIGGMSTLGGSVDLGGFIATYSLIYAMQPNVRTVVDFRARNVAQLGLHLFERRSETDRVRVTTGGLPELIRNPAGPFAGRSKVTRYRFIEDLAIDKAVAGICGAIKVRPAVGAPPRALIRIPPDMMEPSGGSWIAPEKWRVIGPLGAVLVDPEEMVILRYHHPRNNRVGLSPLETLRGTLAEEYAAGQYRRKFWLNAARIEGFLKRAADKPWSEPARERFKAEWKEYTGAGFKVGGTPILEDGMEFQPGSFSAKDAEYISARKLTREECATALHVSPPMVGILDHATYSNIAELHKMLYADTLGPELVSTEEDFELQLFPDFELDPAAYYLEFNIAEKLKGSFEEQASALSTLVGRPILTGNEGRSRLNLNDLPQEDMARAVTPLNFLVGGQPAPNVELPSPDTPGGQAGAGGPDPLLEVHTQKHREVLGGFFARQGQVVKTRLGAQPEAPTDQLLDRARWDGELSTELFALAALTAQAAGEVRATESGAEYDVEAEGLPALADKAGVQAAAVNAATAAEIETVRGDSSPAKAVAHVFGSSLTPRLEELVGSWAAAAVEFGRAEADRVAGRTGGSG